MVQHLSAEISIFMLGRICQLLIKSLLKNVKVDFKFILLIKILERRHNAMQVPLKDTLYNRIML